MFGLGIIKAGLAVIRDLIGRPLRDWSEWADRDPGAAARHIEAIAVVLKSRADAIAERRGDKPWRVRRDRHISRGLVVYAGQLREEAERRKSNVPTSICHGFERVCIEAIEAAKRNPV